MPNGEHQAIALYTCNWLQLTGSYYILALPKQRAPNRYVNEVPKTLKTAIASDKI